MTGDPFPRSRIDCLKSRKGVRFAERGREGLTGVSPFLTFPRSFFKVPGVCGPEGFSQGDDKAVAIVIL